MSDTPKVPHVPVLHSPEMSARFAWIDSLQRPIKAFRLTYLPVLMVYFAYGALGIISLTQTFWVKEQLTFTPAQLAGLAVWFGLPWTVKMVFGEMVDCRQTPSQDYTLEEVVLRVVGDLGIPVAFGLRSGHVSRANITLPFGVKAHLEVGGKVKLKILESATRR